MTLTVLTTAQPPGAGVYVQAVIYAQAILEATAQWAMHDKPKGRVHLHTHAAYRVRPPQTVTFPVSARYQMSAGTHSNAAVTIAAHARFGAHQQFVGSAKFAVHVGYTFKGKELQPPPIAPLAPTIAVHRAATI